MAEGIKIHECEVKDVGESVKKLWLGLSQEMFEIERLIVPSEANGDKWVGFVREGLSSGRNLLLVAKIDNAVVGFAFASIFRNYPLNVSKTIGAIDDVYVLPEFRGKGIGKKLAVECLNKMKAASVKAVTLQVLTENKAAIRLYEKLGFKTYRYGMVKQISQHR